LHVVDCHAAIDTCETAVWYLRHALISAVPRFEVAMPSLAVVTASTKYRNSELTGRRSSSSVMCQLGIPGEDRATVSLRRSLR
jgi:hypothetical protein